VEEFLHLGSAVQVGMRLEVLKETRSEVGHHCLQDDERMFGAQGQRRAGDIGRRSGGGRELRRIADRTDEAVCPEFAFVARQAVSACVPLGAIPSPPGQSRNPRGRTETCPPHQRPAHAGVAT
jgi:hypothetical protein